MWVDVLLVALAWAVVAWFAPRIDWRAWQARFSFFTYIGIVLAATFRNATVALAVDTWAGLPDLSRLLQYLATTGIAVAWMLVCFSIAPPAVRRQRWLLGYAALAVVAMIGLWAMQVGSGQAVQAYALRTNDYSVWTTLVAQSVLCLTSLLVGLPTQVHSFRLEPNPVLRLRLAASAGLQLSAVAMTGAVIGVHLLILAGVLPRDHNSRLITGLMLLTALAFIVTILPAAVYAGAVRGLRHLKRLWQLVGVRRFEQQTAAALGQRAMPLVWPEAVRAPDYALYTLVIAILDRRKALRESERPEARPLNEALGELGETSVPYARLVRGLQRAGLGR